MRGYPTIKFFNGGDATEYSAGRQADDIVNWLKKKTGPPATLLTSAEKATEFSKSAEAVVVGFFGAEDSDSAKAFLGAAAKIDGVPAGIVTDKTVAEALKATLESIVMFQQVREEGEGGGEGEEEGGGEEEGERGGEGGGGRRGRRGGGGEEGEGEGGGEGKEREEGRGKEREEGRGKVREEGRGRRGRREGGRRGRREGGRRGRRGGRRGGGRRGRRGGGRGWRRDICM